MQIKLGVMRYGTTGSIGETWQDLGQQAAVQKLTSIHLSFAFSIYNTVSDNPIQFITQMLTRREFQGFTSSSTPDDTSSLATLDDQSTSETHDDKSTLSIPDDEHSVGTPNGKNTLVIPDDKNASILFHRKAYVIPDKKSSLTTPNDSNDSSISDEKNMLSQLQKTIVRLQLRQ